MNIDLKNIPCFGVAGNFTGHLEQAGEDKDFTRIVVKEVNAPKALFPTYIPGAKGSVPEFLGIFPFDSEKIYYPEGQQKLQIEPECAIVFDVQWKEGKISALTPICFGASNDCSIRREGAKKISLKKNWGASSKGFSAAAVPLKAFSPEENINDYRIASFLVRDGNIFDYGEDSRVRDYSYVYKKLTDWIIEKLNFQIDEGPAENIGTYLKETGCPGKIMVSIGATRYTDFGEKNFLKAGDESVVVLYPETFFSHKDIEKLIIEGKGSDSGADCKLSEDNSEKMNMISILRQKVILK